MIIERPHKFTDSMGGEYFFGIITKIIFDEHFVLKKAKTAHISSLIETSFGGYYNKVVVLSEDLINDKIIWNRRCPEFSEEFRLYLLRFLKLSAFF